MRKKEITIRGVDRRVLMRLSETARHMVIKKQARDSKSVCQENLARLQDCGIIQNLRLWDAPLKSEILRFELNFARLLKFQGPFTISTIMLYKLANRMTLFIYTWPEKISWISKLNSVSINAHCECDIYIFLHIKWE